MRRSLVSFVFLVDTILAQLMYLPLLQPVPFYGQFDNGMDFMEYSPLAQIVASISHLVEMHQEQEIAKQRVGEFAPSNSASKLINSLPSKTLPIELRRIGDYMTSNTRENVYDLRKIAGFPIRKSHSNDNENILKDHSGNNGATTLFDIGKKLLGVDELPTAEEGSAIAQLWEEYQNYRKFMAKKQNLNSYQNN